MTVTVDTTGTGPTENVRTGTTSPQTFSHAGAASGVKGVVLALVHGTSSTDHVSAASYGGVAMARIQRNVDTANEPGAAELWFLGAGVPQGTQTVSYTPGATTDDFHAVVITLLGAGNLEVVDNDGISENVANPSVTLQYGGKTCMAFAALYGGGADPTAFTPNANCTTVHDHDIAAFYSEVIRQTTAGSADFAIGGTSSTDDVAFAAIAVSEAVQLVAVGQATETDEVLAATINKARAVGLVEEADAALAVTLGGDQVIPVGLAEETDSALTVVKAKALAIGIVVETAIAQTFGRLKSRVVGLLDETASAFSVSRLKSLLVGLPTEADVSLAAGRSKRRELGLTTEADAALAVTPPATAAEQATPRPRAFRRAFRTFRVGR